MQLDRLELMLQQRRAGGQRLTIPESTGLVDVLQLTIAPVFGVGAAEPGATDDEALRSSVRCLQLAYGGGGDGAREEDAPLLAAAVLHSEQHLPCAALFVNLILERLAADGLSPAVARSALDAVDAICAAVPVATARQLLPGIASKLVNVAVRRLRQRGASVVPLSHAMDRLALKCIESVSKLSRATLTGPSQGPKDEAWVRAAFPKLCALADPLLRTLINVVVESADATDVDAESERAVATALCSFAYVNCGFGVPGVIAPESNTQNALELIFVSLCGRTPQDSVVMSSTVTIAASALSIHDVALRLVMNAMRGEVNGLSEAQRRLLLVTGAALVLPRASEEVKKAPRGAFRLCAAASPANGDMSTSRAHFVQCLWRCVIGGEGAATRMRNAVRALTGIINDVVLPIIDDWDDYAMHAPSLVALTQAFQVVAATALPSKLAQLANLVVFGGLWDAVWSVTGLTRHVWQVQHRWEECSQEQKQHRATLVSAAINCAVELAATCILTPATASGANPAAADAENVCLMALVPRLLEVCASATNDDVRRAALKGVQRLGLAVFPQAKSAAAAAAFLVTRCVDHISDAVLMTLTQLDVKVNQSRSAAEFRSHPEQGDAHEEALAAESSDAPPSHIAACVVLEAFLLVVADAMRTTLSSEDVAAALDVGERVHSFVHAALVRLTSLLGRSHSSVYTERLLRAMCGAVGFVGHSQVAFDAGMKEKGLPPLKQESNADLVDPRDLCYDRCLPLWLSALHQASCQAMDVVLPLITSAPVAATREAAIRFCSMCVVALSSRCAPRVLLDAANVADEPLEVAQTERMRREPQLSDNYLTYAHRLHAALLACLETVREANYGVSRHGAAALQPAKVAQMLGSIDTTALVGPPESAAAIEARKTVGAFVALPLLSDTSAACIEAGATLLALAPFFLAERVANQLAPLALLHYLHHAAHRDLRLLKAANELWSHERLMALLPARRHHLDVAHDQCAGALGISPATLRGRRMDKALRQLVATVEQHDAGISTVTLERLCGLAGVPFHHSASADAD